MSEIWMPITGFEGIYEVSNLGRVKNAKGKIRKPFIAHGGYLMVDLVNHYERTHARVNRLVAKAFIPNPADKPEVNHKDGDKANNAADNLEWSTKSENMLHAYRSKLQTKGKFPVREVVCLNDGKVYATAGEAARAYGLNTNTVTSCCRRLSKRGKLTFRYIEKERRTDAAN